MGKNQCTSWNNDEKQKKKKQIHIWQTMGYYTNENGKIHTIHGSKYYQGL